ncbi:hypothetical protein [Hydrogenobacter hydrogenophilus]|uniref:Uncharacterized protein n=1 Tax=Hydrogenobacter hydrogenophilus TaxID=35835 RepID=A0A285NZI5_9AQUI|nr:hypothetical protein [Hydrogenobacter hydrogenophilus]SNZ14437.1 hypothetical protein SAMN06265353_1094 [Hydrogenobacter hydrogenophilus]
MTELLAFLTFLGKLLIAMLLIGIPLLLIIVFLSNFVYKRIFLKDEDQSKP